VYLHGKRLKKSFIRPKHKGVNPGFSLLRAFAFFTCKEQIEMSGFRIS